MPNRRALRTAAAAAALAGLMLTASPADAATTTAPPPRPPGIIVNISDELLPVIAIEGYRINISPGDEWTHVAKVYAPNKHKIRIDGHLTYLGHGWYAVSRDAFYQIDDAPV